MAKTIMIVDDSVSMRHVVGTALKGEGYDVLEGCDGRDALAKLNGRKVHLIISDVNMPNMDGISFVKAVKQLPAYKFTPIIMLTTESEEARKLEGQAAVVNRSSMRSTGPHLTGMLEGQAAGAKAWVVKPFQPARLLLAVQKLCLP